MRRTSRILEELADLRRAEAGQHAKTQALIDHFARRGDEDRQRAEDERRIDREILRRNEIVMRDLLETMADSGSSRAAPRKPPQEAAREAAEATRAHTRAIFALIDQLGNGPRPAAGGA